MNENNMLDLKPIIANFENFEDACISYLDKNLNNLFKDIIDYPTFQAYLVNEIYDPFDNFIYNGLLLTIERMEADYDAMRKYFSIIWDLAILNKQKFIAFVISKNSDLESGVRLFSLYDSSLDNSMDDLADYIMTISEHGYIRVLVIKESFYKNCPSGRETIDFTMDEFDTRKISHEDVNCAGKTEYSDDNTQEVTIDDSVYPKDISEVIERFKKLSELEEEEKLDDRLEGFDWLRDYDTDDSNEGEFDDYDSYD